MNLTYELSVAQGLARKAGQMALAMKNNLTVFVKENNEGPVTNADIAINEFICQELSNEFPIDLVIGEESRQTKEPSWHKRCWLIDPIDGTRSYAAGKNDYVIMIGLSIKGNASLGVVYWPPYDVLWQGIFDHEKQTGLAEKIDKGHTSRLISKNIRQRPKELIMLSSASHRSKKQALLKQKLHPAKVICKSSMGLKAMYIAQGLANLYVVWSKRVKLWDTCAPTAILKACECRINFLDGKPLDFCGGLAHKKPIVMTDFPLDESLLAILSQVQNIA